jgi:hypothetical protein
MQPRNHPRAGNYTASNGNTYHWLNKKYNYSEALEVCQNSTGSHRARMVTYFSSTVHREVEQAFITQGNMNASTSYWYGWFQEQACGYN